MNTQDEFSEILKQQLAEAISASQTVAAIQLQAAQGDLVRVANVIINASAVAAVDAVISAFDAVGIIPSDRDRILPTDRGTPDAGCSGSFSGPAE